jgi:hypothetical protein
VAVVVAGCATPAGYESRPWPPRPTEAPAYEAPPAPVEKPAVPPQPPPTPPAPVTPLPLPPPAPSHPSPGEIKALAARLLPDAVRDRGGWAGDIATAFHVLHIAPEAGKLCAAIAVIDQESSFNADPPVPGLPRIVHQEIETRRKRYGIPALVVDAALAMRSSDGRTYAKRIDALRTERQMSELFEEMIAQLPLGEQLFARYNPVRTGGPMQVGVEFAQQQVRAAPYPYEPMESVRREVFTRRGGLYFGIAYLLDYPAPYASPLYRFADFNAGRYSARNAAFQQAVSRLSGHRLSLDGDLLRYAGGVPDPQTVSETQRALQAIDGLRMTSGDTLRDLKLEKSPAFQDTRVYRRVFALADVLESEPAPRAAMPRIDLKSPKIKRRLTTEWFAKRVHWRYGNCLARAPDNAAFAPQPAH